VILNTPTRSVQILRGSLGASNKQETLAINGFGDHLTPDKLYQVPFTPVILLLFAEPVTAPITKLLFA
jgi:hypothetical protein